MARWRSISNSPAGARGRLHKFGDLRAIARYFTIRPDFGERRRAALGNTRETLVLVCRSSSFESRNHREGSSRGMPRRESTRDLASIRASSREIGKLS